MHDATSDEGVLAFVYDRQMSPTVGVLVLHLGLCKIRARDEGWTIAGEWIDQGDAVFSDENRPAFDAMIEAMKTARGAGHEVLCLIADWPRLSRDEEARQAFQARIRTAGGYIATGVGGDDKQGLSQLSASAVGAL